VSGIRKKRGRIRGEAVAGLDEHERGIQADSDDEGAAEVRGVGMAAMTMRAVTMPVMIVPVVRVTVVGSVVMMAALHTPSLEPFRF
jgi:hypothetical protein